MLTHASDSPLNQGVRSDATTRRYQRQELADADQVRLVTRAFAGDRAAIGVLARVLTPVVRARVLRKLLRHHALHSRCALAQQYADDLVQDVLEALFSRQGRVLLAWQPQRGMSLKSFVGLVAERHTGMYLRSGRRNCFREEQLGDELQDSDDVGSRAAVVLEARSLLSTVVARLRQRLSPTGLRVFNRLFLEACSIEEVATSTGLSRAAVYAWRSRIMRAARTLRERLCSQEGRGRRISVRK